MSQSGFQHSWNMNRREFMKGAALATAGKLLQAQSLAQTSDQLVQPTGVSQAEVGRVPERPLGKRASTSLRWGWGATTWGRPKVSRKRAKLWPVPWMQV
jgi:hypothetical protein